MEKPSISIVISAKNEEKTIAEIVEKTKPFGQEVLVVDGHSKDKTREIAAAAGARVILDNRKGKGEAIRCAIPQVQGDIIVFIDADGSHDPNDIPRLTQPIIEDKADLVIGSRGMGGSDELHGDISKFFRMVASDIITLGINYRFGARLTDSQNGFRAVKTSVIRQLNLQENITTIEQEMTIKALKRGFRITEVPSHEYKRRFGQSRFTVGRVAFRYFYTWLKYLFFS